MRPQTLLVDDSRSALEQLKHLIDSWAMVETTSFLDPVEALAAARDREFDIVLVDYDMPSMDGISFIAPCARWRAMPTSRS